VKNMTIQNVKKLLKKHKRTWKDFLVFMRGQTVAMRDGVPHFFEDDVYRFLEGRAVDD